MLLNTQQLGVGGLNHDSTGIQMAYLLWSVLLQTL